MKKSDVKFAKKAFERGRGIPVFKSGSFLTQSQVNAVKKEMVARMGVLPEKWQDYFEKYVASRLVCKSQYNPIFEISIFGFSLSFSKK